MKKKVVKKVFVCRECGSRDLKGEGYIRCTMDLRYDDEGNYFFEIIDYDSSDCIDITEYSCGDCGEPPCIDDSEVQDEGELEKYIELYGVEQEFEIEVPEDQKIEA